MESRAGILPRIGSGDRLEEWLHEAGPVLTGHGDRLETRKARESDFPAIYDLVDEAFGFERPRSQYEWLYRDNPNGRALCWVVVERSTGRLIASRAAWPWPLARGSEAMIGVLAGDGAVSPRWQRRGLSSLISDSSARDPARGKTTLFGWANAKSRGAAVKRGNEDKLLGAVVRGTLLVRSEATLTNLGWPKLASGLAGRALDLALSVHTRLRLGRARGVSVRPVHRFDSRFDPVTLLCMSWSGLWSPHDAAFLNWRYFDHPTHRYAAWAAWIDDQLAGYYVLRIAPEPPHLMELAAPSQPPSVARALLHHAVASARAAGCARLDFFAAPGWRHWPLLRAAGFLIRSADLVLGTSGPFGSEATRMEQWQIVPGDHDVM